MGTLASETLSCPCSIFPAQFTVKESNNMSSNVHLLFKVDKYFAYIVFHKRKLGIQSAIWLSVIQI